MAKLYYGNGNCNIEGTGVRCIHIKHSGNVEFEDTTSNSFALMQRAGGVIIFPIGKGFLNDLFKYRGELRINDVVASDDSGNRIPVSIIRSMDYAELLGKSESLTIRSEDLKTTNISGGKVKKSSTKHKIIPNLHTTKLNTQLFYESGELYQGNFHINLDHLGVMTGSEHTETSIDLYYRQIINGELSDKITPTRIR